MSIPLPKLIATSVVRGSEQGQSHGGVFTIDFEHQVSEQHLDWNNADIDWEGRGADRGLRGIAFDGGDIYIAASDELFCFDKNFKLRHSKKNRYLKHCHEICRMGRKLLLTSTGHDCILAYDLDERVFVWGFHLQRIAGDWGGFTFDPRRDSGPGRYNEHHINMVHVDSNGIFLSGLRTGALLHITHDNRVQAVCSLPLGTHNARPYKDGVIFNDTGSDHVRFVSRERGERSFTIKHYDTDEIELAGIDDSKIARQAFGRGLCVYKDRILIGGSSPSTISLYDITTGETIGSVNMTMDIRNAIHGLEIWPF